MLVPRLSFYKRINKEFERELPIKGKPLVNIGDLVKSNDKVLESEILGDLSIIKIDPEIINVDNLKIKKLDTVKEGDLIFERRSFFNLFKDQTFSKYSGVVEYINLNNGHIGIRDKSTSITINAFVDGEVVQINENSIKLKTSCAYFQGIFGIGGEQSGEIALIDNEKITLDSFPKDIDEKVLVGGFSPSAEVLEFINKSKAKGLICGSIDYNELSKFLGYEIGVAITGREDIDFSLIITEGFGDFKLSPRIVELAKENLGKRIAINGTTQVRAGARRADAVICFDYFKKVKIVDDNQITKGDLVKIIRYPYFGKIGKVAEVLDKRVVLETKSVVNCAQVIVKGQEIIVPIINLELI